MPSDRTAIGVIGSTLAANLAQVLSDAGRPVDEYAYVPSQPVDDWGFCGVLTVFSTGLDWTPTRTGSGPMDEGQRARLFGGGIPRAGYAVQVWRCIDEDSGGDNATPVPLAQLQADAMGLAEDLFILWNALTAGLRNHNLWAEGTQLFVLPATPIDRQGGRGGWTIPIQIALEGYDPWQVL